MKGNRVVGERERFRRGGFFARNASRRDRHGLNRTWQPFSHSFVFPVDLPIARWYAERPIVSAARLKGSERFKTGNATCTSTPPSGNDIWEWLLGWKWGDVSARFSRWWRSRVSGQREKEKRNARHARGESLKTNRRILNPRLTLLGRPFSRRAPKHTFKCYRACPSNPSRFVYGSGDEYNNSFLLFTQPTTSNICNADVAREKLGKFP